ncbi:MAG TPA: DUF1800 domain-containing protein [Urbifossiella sp.]|nr:DUF1800 domain-containing protein [Urbifossiella sp.]
MATRLPSDLSKVDPAQAWAPFEPSAAIPWNEKWIAHFYRRAAFGANATEISRAKQDGFPKTLARIMAGEPDAASLLDVFTDAGRYLKSDLQIRVWWLALMLDGGHPLREKLTLFWHNHFATSYAKVQRTQLMFEQNLLLRQHALGRFPPFLLAMSRDTAMLKWLDSNQNVVGAPNENFAREVMELFALGVGHYTEKDIQEAARAFTGWHVDARTDADEDTFRFKPVLHDNGTKTVFGRTGNWNGDDIIAFCCDRPDCAKFLVSKLYAYLISETRPPESLLTPLEERFRKSDYDIADLVRTLLSSRLFFSEHAYRKRVKWPVEYVLGAIRAAVPGRAPLGDLVDPLAKMGQVLFAPPNVKGWRTGTDWLNSATLLARNNFAETVATGNWKQTSVKNPGPPVAAATKTAVDDIAPADPLPRYVDFPEAGSSAVAGAAAAATFPTTPSVDGMRTVAVVPPRKPPPSAPPAPPPDAGFDVAAALFKPPPNDVHEVVARMGAILYGEPISPSARAKIEKFLLDGKKTLAAKDLDNLAFRAKAREALHALMCLPEYQLN